jgi:hypothetical protein
MEKSSDQKLSKSVAELRDYMFRAGTSEGIDLERAVEMFLRCECMSKEDRGELANWAAFLLARL